MEHSDVVRRRSCRRTFILLADGGVLVRWACGAQKHLADEMAVDMEILVHLEEAQHHHHRPHLHKG